MLRTGLLFTVCIAISGSCLSAQEKPPAEARNAASRFNVWPGIRPGGKMQLPTQWSLKPAGKQVPLGDFPVNIAMHPDNKWCAILHAGYGEHEVVVVDLTQDKVISRVSLPQVFQGITFNHAGDRLFVSGGEHELVYRFTFREGFLAEKTALRIVPEKEIFVPIGISVSADDSTLYIAGGWGDRIAILPTNATSETAPKFIELTTEDYPYYVLPARDGKHLYVSLWGHAKVLQIEISTGQTIRGWETAAHPTEMLLHPQREQLFVSCANSNSVVVIDLAHDRVLEQITSALFPAAPVGSTPNSISISASGKALLIANADNNNLALFDISEAGKSRSLGYIPSGWYPTSVRFHGVNDRILVANGKGMSSKANPQGPRPGQEFPAPVREYIAGLFKGTLGVIASPSPEDLAKYTRTAFECSPLQSDNATRSEERSADNPVPAKVGDASPIKYCLYIIKENRTYDQVFGDLPQGNGDPTLCLFGEKVTPNHHALARQFVLLDNFYVESEVSADGHEWSMAAYATDFTEKTWPLLYRGSKHGKLKYPAEGSLPIAASSGGYIWDRCHEAKVSFRSYGEFVVNPKTVGERAKARVKSLEGHIDEFFHGYDLEYPDVKRADHFIAELKKFEAAGDMPRMQVLRLPNDHTQGTALGKPTPTAMVADNDLALGRVIEALSQSKFWPQLAVFVVEDDAQNGSDHVDAHRTVALVVSPYTKRKFVDSNMYSTASMLRTMELILGLKPMSQFDAAALPMYNSFQSQPDLAPYTHVPAQVDLQAKNGRDAWRHELSAKLDFSREDAADDLLLNEIVWRSVRGAHSRMPAPVRASFVFADVESEEEEEEED